MWFHWKRNKIEEKKAVEGEDFHHVISKSKALAIQPPFLL